METNLFWLVFMSSFIPFLSLYFCRDFNLWELKTKKYNFLLIFTAFLSFLIIVFSYIGLPSPLGIKLLQRGFLFIIAISIIGPILISILDFYSSNDTSRKLRKLSKNIINIIILSQIYLIVIIIIYLFRLKS